MDRQNLTLLTDLYELTMMQGYFNHKDMNETVIFDAFFRHFPAGGHVAGAENRLIAELEQVGGLQLGIVFYIIEQNRIHDLPSYVDFTENIIRFFTLFCQLSCNAV